jgi:hypothetical protein
MLGWTVYLLVKKAVSFSLKGLNLGRVVLHLSSVAGGCEQAFLSLSCVFVRKIADDMKSLMSALLVVARLVVPLEA